VRFSWFWRWLAVRNNNNNAWIFNNNGNFNNNNFNNAGRVSAVANLKKCLSVRNYGRIERPDRCVLQGAKEQTPFSRHREVRSGLRGKPCKPTAKNQFP
jgi:hypothetical protein